MFRVTVLEHSVFCQFSGLLETIIVTLSRVLALDKRRRFRREEDKKKKQKRCRSHITSTLFDDDFMMSLSSLSFVHPKNVVGFQNPIREKSRSNVIEETKTTKKITSEYSSNSRDGSRPRRRSDETATRTRKLGVQVPLRRRLSGVSIAESRIRR